MAVEAAAHANICALAKELAGVSIKFGISRDMDAVGAEALGQSDIGFDETGHAGSLDKIDDAVGDRFVDRLAVIAKQNTGRRAVR